VDLQFTPPLDALPVFFFIIMVFASILDWRTFERAVFATSTGEEAMRSVGVGALFAIAALFCATPLSLQWSQGKVLSVSIAINSAKAAELDLRPRRSARRGYSVAYYGRLYHPFCGGPYVGGGWNGGTYYGGPWMDLRCYGAVY
jgi:hypothetical protein